jgi:hypothetical protein
VKTLLLAGVAALSMLSVSMATDESDPPAPPPPPRFRPWQQVWQCNDIRVTITGRDPFSFEYDRVAQGDWPSVRRQFHPGRHLVQHWLRAVVLVVR